MRCLSYCASYCASCQPLLRAFSGTPAKRLPASETAPAIREHQRARNGQSTAKEREMTAVRVRFELGVGAASFCALRRGLLLKLCSGCFPPTLTKGPNRPISDLRFAMTANPFGGVCQGESEIYFFSMWCCHESWWKAPRTGSQQQASLEYASSQACCCNPELKPDSHRCHFTFFCRALTIPRSLMLSADWSRWQGRSR